jgi:hypothetical protein
MRVPIEFLVYSQKFPVRKRLLLSRLPGRLTPLRFPLWLKENRVARKCQARTWQTHLLVESGSINEHKE